MPILDMARSYFWSRSRSNSRSRSAGQCSQPLAWISLSSWPGAPAGVPERQDRPVRPLAAGNRLEDVDGGGERHAVVDRQRGIGHVVVGAVQHETAARLDRAADMHLAFRSSRATSSPLPPSMLSWLEQLAEADVRRALVDDQAHGAFGRVRAHIDDRAREALVGHDRHGHQQLPVEVAVVVVLALPGRSHRLRLPPRSRACEEPEPSAPGTNRGVLNCYQPPPACIGCAQTTRRS